MKYNLMGSRLEKKFFDASCPIERRGMQVAMWIQRCSFRLLFCWCSQLSLPRWKVGGWKRTRFPIFLDLRIIGTIGSSWTGFNIRTWRAKEKQHCIHCKTCWYWLARTFRLNLIILPHCVVLSTSTWFLDYWRFAFFICAEIGPRNLEPECWKVFD